MIDVTAQPYEALLLFHGVALAGLCYLLLRTVRIRCRSRLATHLCDAVFVVVLFALLESTGTPRAFGLADGDVAECRILGPEGFAFAPLINPVIDLKLHPELA